MRTGLARLGAAEVAAACATSGRFVLLKPNMLRPSPADRGVTTHPVLVEAVARWFVEAGAPVRFGDSPNGVFSAEAAARRSGIRAAAEAAGAVMAGFDVGEEVSYPAGVQNRRFRIARSVVEAGAVVNIPKLKTHPLTRITASMKNMFGVVPGGHKAAFHVRHPDGASFSRMIADLNGLVRSRLVVMDAVDAMEGNGPSGGDLVRLGLLLFSDDPVAADAVACRIIGLDPLQVPMIRFADEAGVGNAQSQNIDLAGEDPSAFRPASFRVPGPSVTDRLPRSLARMARDLVVPRPVIDPTVCTACGECVSACPATPRAIALPERSGATVAGHRVPRYDYTACIRCYCCQETCSRGAIGLARAPLARFFGDRSAGDRAGQP